MGRYKAKALRDDISANLRLIELSSTGEINNMSLGEVGVLVNRVYGARLDGATVAKVAMAWSSGSKKRLLNLRT